MSIATDQLSSLSAPLLRMVEKDARQIAKEYGVKIRRNRHSGIDVTYPDGEKLHYFGWYHLRNEMVRLFDLAE